MLQSALQERISYQQISVFKLLNGESWSQLRRFVTQLHSVENGLLVVFDLPGSATN